MTQVMYFPSYPCCLKCGYLVHSEFREDETSPQTIISCANRQCVEFGKRLVLRAQIFDCEEAP